MKVYILTQSSGSYEDYYNEIIGVYDNKELALEVAKQIDELYIIEEKDYPMTFQEYQDLNYGYPENDDLHLVSKGGYSIKDFEEMERIQSVIHNEYHACKIEEFELKTNKK